MKKYINVDVARRIIDSPRSKEQMLMVLGSAEPADVVEVVHGEWIDKGEDYMIRWTCSNCGRRDTHIYNFCPDCGADMRGGRNELYKRF